MTYTVFILTVKGVYKGPPRDVGAIRDHHRSKISGKINSIFSCEIRFPNVDVKISAATATTN